MDTISYDATTGSFFLRLRSSVYVLRILPGGEVVHIGFAPLVPDAPERLAAARLDDYKDANYVWDERARAYEYPAYGEFSHRESAFKAAFPKAPGALEAGEVVNLPVRDVRLRYHSHEVRTDALPAGAAIHRREARDPSPRPTLCLRLKDEAYAFFVTLFYRVTAECDLIERWV